MINIGSHVMDNLAEELVKEGLISRDQLSVARVTRQDLGEDLGHILVRKGYVTEIQLLTLLGKLLSVPYVSLQNQDIDPNLIQKVPLHVARRYHLMPLREENGKLLLAMSNPLDVFAIEEVKGSSRKDVTPVLSSSDEIDLLIAKHYGLKKHRKSKDADYIEVLDFSHEESADKAGEKIEAAAGPRIVQEVNRMIVQAYQEKASDIHLEPSRDDVRLRYRIDGFLEDRERFPKDMLFPLVSRIKIMGGLDIAERRIPQDGRVRIQIGGMPLDLRVATYPTFNGEKVVMRLLSKEGNKGIESLGFCEKDRKTFSELISRSHGIFLVTGPTGSGKSTTLYAALSRINSPDKNVISIEDPIESEIAGVNQAQINLKAGLTFASALRSILRLDPDVIMLGEIRDSETAEIAVRAAITGHLVLSTLHTNTAAGAISRLVDLGVPPFMIASALIGVLAQRLVRKICPACRMEVEPDLQKLGALSAYIKKCFRGKGCPNCRMSGYMGRVGIFEMAPTGDEVRKKISQHASDMEIEQELRRSGVRSIMADGLERVNEGITTFEEVLRVSQEG